MEVQRVKLSPLSEKAVFFCPNLCLLGSSFSKSILLLEWVTLFTAANCSEDLLESWSFSRLCFHSNIFRSKFLIMNFRNIRHVFDLHLDKFDMSACQCHICMSAYIFQLLKKLFFQKCSLISKSAYHSCKPKHNHSMDSNEVV